MKAEDYLARIRAMTDEQKAGIYGETDEEKAEHLKSCDAMMQPHEGVTIFRAIGRKANGDYRVVRADWHESVPATKNPN